MSNVLTAPATVEAAYRYILEHATDYSFQELTDAASVWQALAANERPRTWRLNGAKCHAVYYANGVDVDGAARLVYLATMPDGPGYWLDAHYAA